MWIIIDKSAPDWLFIKSDENGKPLQYESIDGLELKYYEEAVKIN